jgi:hypothetical protein
MIKADDLAKLFHTSYEKLAPLFGYKTREASAVPWHKVPVSNKNLMIATAALVLMRLDPFLKSIRDAERDALLKLIREHATPFDPATGGKEGGGEGVIAYSIIDNQSKKEEVCLAQQGDHSYIPMYLIDQLAEDFNKHCEEKHDARD